MSTPPPLVRLLARAPWPWLAALAVVALLSLGTYGATQQVLRSGANDPQVQLAHDAAARLASGAGPADVLPAGHVDLLRSLSPWLAVARTGTGVVAANADLHGRAPLPPEGVLAQATRTGENRVTWQPRRGVRMALVAVPVGGGSNLVVLAGRSLRETEERTDRIGRILLLAWLAAEGVIACAWALAAAGRRVPGAS